MPPVLSLYEDIMPNDGELGLEAHARMIFVVHGTVTIGSQTLSDGETWHGETRHRPSRPAAAARAAGATS